MKKGFNRTLSLAKAFFMYLKTPAKAGVYSCFHIVNINVRSFVSENNYIQFYKLSNFLIATFSNF